MTLGKPVLTQGPRSPSPPPSDQESRPSTCVGVELELYFGAGGGRVAGLLLPLPLLHVQNGL